MINDDHKLANLLPHLRTAEWIAIDTEADSLHAYPEKLCLLQISIAGQDELVDPLADISLDLLWPVLRNHELIMHGADYDLRLLRRTFQFIPHHVFDTMIAARLLGYQEFSLTHLVSAKLGVTLEKGPQKMDWARRPLTERMERYARNDTRYLRPVAARLYAELETTGRLGWLKESCARLIREASQPKQLDPELVWRIKGSDRLTPKGLAILRELWHWREKEALEANKPPYFILSHEHLVSLAAKATHGPAILHHLPFTLPTGRKERLRMALERSLRLPPSNLPAPRQSTGSRLTRAEQSRVEELRKLRDRRAAELRIDPALIASRGMLISLARNGGSAADELMHWQRHLLLGG